MNIVRTRDGRCVAVSEPTRASYEVDAASLRTVGKWDYGGRVGLLHTAHPLRYGGGFVNVATSLAPPRYAVYTLDGNLRNPVERCALAPSRAFPDVSWHHSFARAGKYVVIIETPCVYNLGALLGAADAAHVAFDWRDGAETLLRVVDADAGREVARRTCERSFFFFHVANAFVEGGVISIDLAAYDDAAMVNGLSLERMRDDPRSDGAPESRLVRVSVDIADTAAEPATVTPLDDASKTGRFCEFPVVDPRRDGVRHDAVYSVGARAEFQPDSRYGLT